MRCRLLRASASERFRNNKNLSAVGECNLIPIVFLRSARPFENVVFLFCNSYGSFNYNFYQAPLIPQPSK